MVYYPVPLNKQEAFRQFVDENLEMPVTEMLCDSVLSLPIHTEMNDELLRFISNSVKSFFE
jgi:dTDP-4-amino-4,6-dideoxygalactose transaminase